MAGRMEAHDSGWIDRLLIAVDHALAELDDGHSHVDLELIRDLEAIRLRLRAQRHGDAAGP